jgi:GDPmannose 4,6-dehydratase
MKTAVVLGATGQDGSFLVGELLARGFRVICGVRKSSGDNLLHLREYMDDVKYSKHLVLEEFDLSDSTSLYRIIATWKPDWLFNEADQDHVGWSYKLPSYSIQVTTDAVTTICEAIRLCSPKTKVFLPVSSNIFGNAYEGKISSKLLVDPISPYGIAKAAVLHLSNYFRSTHNLNIVTGILFNHESHKRGDYYLTKKLAKAVAKIFVGTQNTVTFGDLDTKVDWGCAEEFTRIFCDVMETDFRGNIVIGTGELTKVSDLVENSFNYKGLNAYEHISIDQKLKRPIKMAGIFADTSLIKSVTGKVPTQSAQNVIEKMIDWEICKATI